MPFPDCSPLLSLATKYHRCELQIINIQNIKKSQHMSTIRSYFSQFIAPHFIKGLNVENEGITLKFRTNIGTLLKCRNVGNVRQLGGLNTVKYIHNNFLTTIWLLVLPS